MKKWNGSHPVLTLEINGIVAAERVIDQQIRFIKYWQHRWFYQYALASQKNWQIYIVIRSTMGNFKPKRFTRTEFPFLIKSKSNQNGIIENVADATIADIES